jgi:hypothetical protein
MELIHYPEMSVKDYHSMLHNIPAECRSHQRCGWSLKSWTTLLTVTLQSCYSHCQSSYSYLQATVQVIQSIFKPSGMLHRINGQTVPNTFTDHRAFIFRITQCKKSATILQNTRNYLSNDKAAHTHIFQSWVKPHREPQISCHIQSNQLQSQYNSSILFLVGIQMTLLLH